MPETKQALRVFFCYSHADRDAVRVFYDRLTKNGIDAWLDKENLIPGQDWELEIRKAVRETNVVLVCLSKQFNQAGYRQKEVRLALDTAMEQPEGEIFIIPARLEECETPESLRKWQWVELFEEDGYSKLMRALRVRAEKIGVKQIPIEHSISAVDKYITRKEEVAPQLKIMVTGGKVISKAAEKAAYTIGGQVIIRGHALINNGAIGVDLASANGALRACKERLLSPDHLIEVYRPNEDPDAAFDFGNLHLVGKTYNQRRDFVLGITDVVIVVGGGAGTRKVINHALRIGKPLIPIGVGNPTEAAFDFWQKMFMGFIESPIDIEDLIRVGHKQDMETVAINTISLAENLVGK